ncbi:hypothetical protein Moror_6092 [Moniliophthora roreri MCA 2997]|uniref:Uncharacterized protein n=1 Tax=Moniliophthora roreri (strain MCA 2997) TaxID=1381753 RepID=V2XYT7_MONRO|nr:hypothetical protein Moror_6092 [Moniliophthora roreri MCA 2997]
MGNLVVSGGSPSEFASWDAQVAHEKRPETIWPPVSQHQGLDKNLNSEGWPDSKEWRKSVVLDPGGLCKQVIKRSSISAELFGSRSEEYPPIPSFGASAIQGNTRSCCAMRLVRDSSSFPEEYCTTPARFPVLEEDRSSYQDFELRGLAKVKEMTMSDVLNLDGPKFFDNY